MNIFQAMFLGMVQGLTEFLPVSSSGHLVLFQRFIPGFSQPGVLFDVVLHLGTLFAIFFYFRKNLTSLTRKYFWFIIIALIPTVVIGFLFQDFFEGLFASDKTLALEFFISGVFCIFIDRIKVRNLSLTWGKSLLIGFFQAISIIPAISRSGATIFAGVVGGISKKQAAEFSFILSVPAVLGALILELVKNGSRLDNLNLTSYFPGFITALIFGVLAIGLVFKLLLGGEFKYFAYYCFIVGALSLII